MTQRINIVISDRIDNLLEELAELYGVSKSSIAALAIGQHVEAMMKQRELMYGDDGLMANIKEKIFQYSRTQIEEHGE